VHIVIVFILFVIVMVHGLLKEYFIHAEGDRRRLEREVQDTNYLLQEVIRAYSIKFGVVLKIRPVTTWNIRDTKRTILKIKRDFDSNVCTGKATRCYKDVRFPYLNTYSFGDIKI